MKRSTFSSLRVSSRRLGALLVLLIAGSGLLWTGCDIGAIDDGIGLIVDFSPASTTVSGQVLDAKTQAPIESAAVTVRFSGPDAGRVVDVDGDALTELTVPDVSLINFNLDGAEPSEDNPAEVSMAISAPGYITTNERVLIGSTDHTFSATLTSVSDTPSGVEATVESFSSRNGAPVEDVTVTTDFEDATGAQTSLRIPAGTVMRDVDGTPLQGNVEATVVYYSNQDDAARDAFPGGFLGVNVTENEDDLESGGSFITAGFAAIEVVDEQGRKARQFDGPIDIEIDVPPGTTNPETGQAVQSGDSVPVYSFNEETGEWVFEGRTEATLADASARKSQGTLAVSFQTQHLTYWNLDWYWSPRCSRADQIMFNGMPANWRGFFRWTLRDAETGQRLRSGSHYRGNFLRFYNAPREWPMTLQMVDPVSGQVVAEGTLNDLCDGGTLDATIPDRVSVDVHATITCDDDTEIRPSNYSVWYRPASGSPWGYARLSSGRATISDLIEGGEYLFYVRLLGRWEIRTVRIQEGETVDGVLVTRTSEDGFRADVDFRDTDGSVCG